MRWWPRHWRVRSRLVALIVIPTVLALALGGLRIYESSVTTVTHTNIEERAEIGVLAAQLSNQLGRERSASAIYISDNPDPGQRSDELRQELDTVRGTTQNLYLQLDSRLADLGELDDPIAQARLESLKSQLDTLEDLREEVDGTRITVLPVTAKYRTITRALTEFNQTIADQSDDTELREGVRALTALSSARDQLSYETALMRHALSRDTMTGGVSEAIESSRARYENEINNFIQAADSAQRRVFDENYTGLDVSQVSTMRMRVMYRAERDADLTGVTDNDGPEDYQEIAARALDRMEEVEVTIAEGVRDDADQLGRAALVRTVTDLSVIAAVLLAVFFVTSLVARSLVRPLRTLEEGARRVAERDLHEAITRMQEAGSAPEAVRVNPIDVHTEDEIGEVARAFDDVHRVALTLASDEAALRSNVNAMFVNLSRRSQTLVERQLRLIDGLEQSEQDSDRLSDLFQLDHLATRMRRNNENLLVLSGQDNTRKWAQPVPLVDVLRGAVSEVEQYERVNVRAPSHISVLGRPVNDIIHLVAELVENATSFSPHDTEVLVSAKTLDNGGVQVDVTDSGIGMAPEDLAAINARLAAPPVVDVAVSRRMGLFVVSRLAHRHSVTLQLMEAHGGGTTARAILPPDLLITPVEGQHSVTGAQPRAELPSGTPDTFADAEAAFASSPAPTEPGDTWQGQEGGVSALGSGLPKRSPGSNRADEHPPSGQDLWNTSRNGSAPVEPTRGAGTTGTPGVDGPQQVVDPYDTPEEQRASDTTGGHSLFDPAPRSGGPRSDFGDTGAPNRSSETGSFARPTDTGAFSRPTDTGAFTRPTDTGAFTRPADTGSRGAFGGSRIGGHDRSPLSGESRTESFPAVSPQPAPSANDTGRWSPGGNESREGYGSTAYLSRRYGGGQGSDSTVVPPTPASENNDSLPIFDAIESNWFKRRTGGPTVDSTETGPIPQVGGDVQRPASEPSASSAPSEPAAPTGGTEQGWNSAADRGWKAARTAADPMAGGLTTSGLPKRVPKANLVPGTAPKPENFNKMPARSADRVRNRFSGFQKGVRDGRNQLGGGSNEG
ncbi:nitrate- and nitrite sensing domain-containing protein [Nocardiopsis sp. LOL_012]|uniref:sensor histidine kinase n=1 Tax=Nocardiopsis sp. LOL_012 TaxID=3345409 RepID=UPI003A881AE5